MSDSLQDWPEPVVPVQSLSESGLTTIPDKYVRPPSNRPSASSGSPGTTSMIPTVDLGGVLSDGSTAAVDAISEACKEWGFFHLVNHGVSLELVEKMRKVWRDFFALPLEEKLKLANRPTTYEGYGSRLGVEGDTLDWGDYFFLYLLPESAKNRDKWPTLPGSLRDITEEYGRELVKLCGGLLRLLSRSLGLEEGLLQRAFGGEDVGACMRVNYYPKCPQPDLTLGLSPHSDPGGLTVLLADDRVKGLQVRKGDSWVTVEPLPGGFVVNVGDQIQVISNGIYKSVEHCVTANSSEERFSIAFFYNPNGNKLIGPAQELVTLDRPPLYRHTTPNEYRWYIRKKGPRGKSQVESLKTF